MCERYDTTLRCSEHDCQLSERRVSDVKWEYLPKKGEYQEKGDTLGMQGKGGRRAGSS